MNLWPVEHFFPQTGQRFIRKEVTSYKIHILDVQSCIWLNVRGATILYDGGFDQGSSVKIL